mgnify:CR=1 FL=1
MNKNHICIIIGLVLIGATLGISPSNINPVTAAPDTYAQQLAEAILHNTSCLVDATYYETTSGGTYQSAILSSKGTLHPTDGGTFVLLSTGKAGADIVSTNNINPGDERGTYFRNDQYQRYYEDTAYLTMNLIVPEYMHYIYYDIQFLTSEYPDYVGSQYNDKVAITVQVEDNAGVVDIIDVNGGDFVLNSHDIPGTGFDIFAIDRNTYLPTHPNDVDWITTTPNSIGADGGSTALIGREQAVEPGANVTFTISIRDTGDNQFDSAVFIDNVRFTGYARTSIISRKTVQDQNGGFAEPGDELSYSITISNIGNADQNNNPGYEFIDTLPQYLDIDPTSLTATSGSATYNASTNQVQWDGSIPAESSIALGFDCTINSSAPNGHVISNQGTVYWDTDEDDVNDATELTDDPNIDDGIDSDKDGETDDDDPTNITITSFETPDSVTETFSDDTARQAASQLYNTVEWFTTTSHTGEGNFHVVDSYHYSTTKSFKTKLRAVCGDHYWIYNPANLKATIKSWQIWFSIGNSSEESDLYLTFQDATNGTITRLNLTYHDVGTSQPTTYLPSLSILSTEGYQPITSSHPGGYLQTGWYQITLELYNTYQLNVTLREPGIGITYNNTISLSRPFHTLEAIKWYSTEDPIICPMIFWDEHTIGLSPTEG